MDSLRKWILNSWDLFNEINTDNEKDEHWKPFVTEIENLKKTLLELDADDTRSKESIEEHAKRSIEEHAKRIKDAMPDDRQDMDWPAPLYRLLDVKPLQNIKIPLSVLELLVSLGFSVNECGKISESALYPVYLPCLHNAIINEHYDAARWLAERSANCDFNFSTESAIARLARNMNAPLDLFDILKTPRNLNGNNVFLPLHEAIQNGNTESALHLINIGAEVSQADAHECLPIDYYVDYTEQTQFHEELFLQTYSTEQPVCFAQHDHQINFRKNVST